MGSVGVPPPRFPEVIHVGRGGEQSSRKRWYGNAIDRHAPHGELRIGLAIPADDLRAGGNLHLEAGQLRIGHEAFDAAVRDIHHPRRLLKVQVRHKAQRIGLPCHDRHFIGNHRQALAWRRGRTAVNEQHLIGTHRGILHQEIARVVGGHLHDTQRSLLPLVRAGVVFKDEQSVGRTEPRSERNTGRVAA